MKSRPHRAVRVDALELEGRLLLAAACQRCPETVPCNRTIPGIRRHPDSGHVAGDPGRYPGSRHGDRDAVGHRLYRAVAGGGQDRPVVAGRGCERRGGGPDGHVPCKPASSHRERADSRRRTQPGRGGCHLDGHTRQSADTHHQYVAPWCSASWRRIRRHRQPSPPNKAPPRASCSRSASRWTRPGPPT